MDNLPEYEPSEEKLKILEAIPIFSSYLNTRQLDSHNICEVLYTLLTIEDLHTTQCYEKLFQLNVEVQRVNRFNLSVKLTELSLNVKGILKPYMDEVHLKSNIKEQYSCLGYKKTLTYSGKITKVSHNEVVFDVGCPDSERLDRYIFDVTFYSPRIPFRLMYQALGQLKKSPATLSYLFPTTNNSSWEEQTSTQLLLNSSIAKNTEQLQAVQHIVAGPNPQAPYIVFGPPDLDFANVQLLGSNRNELLLKCQVEGASGDEPLQIEWYRDSAKLSTWQNVELQQHRLIVRQPSSSDDGLYRCIASNAAARVMSKQGYVYQHQTNSKTKCLPRLKKNQKLPESWDKQIFLCRGKRGGAGGMDQSQSLPPAPEGLRIEQGPNAKLIIKEGEPAALSCLYELPAELQNQRIQLRWRKDGKVLRHVELGGALIPGQALDYGKDSLLREDGRLVLHKQNGTLSFTNIIASDAGQYMCQLQLEGHAMENSAPGILEVIEQLKFVPTPTSKNLELGALGKLHCKAQGTPTPQIQWLRDAPNELLPEHVEDINGTLTFGNVSAEHRGNYTCLASNSQGQINATVSINVVVTPKFSVAPVGPIETVEQDVAVIHCQAIGDPMPTIQWDKDLQFLSENNTDRQRFSFLENGTLEIRNVQAEDEGKYGCTIGNSAGFKRVEVRLLVRASGDGFLTEETAGDGFLVTRAVLITMTVALAYIVLVVGLMLWCRYRRQARKARLNELSIKEAGGEPTETGKNTEQEPCLSKQQRNGHSKSRAANGDAQKSDDTACSQQSRASKKSAHVYEQLALPRSGLSELIQIGRGEFGDVFVGKLKGSLVTASLQSDKDTDTEKQHSNSENGSGASGSGSTTLSTLNEKRRSKTSMDDIEEIKEEEQQPEHSETTPDQLVLVKALNKVKDEQACQEFRRQLDLLRAISHKGVVRLFGLCRDKDPHYMVLEYTDWGDLKQFLLATAGKVNTATATSSPPPLTTSQILAVAYQIARGMDAIYRARFTHRDLATRNCVISSEFIVKVAYPALCKDKYSREYHKHRNTLLPVRWLAPECIQEDEYTTKSDIFAFGVVVWELFNQATKLPHEELTNELVVQRALANTLEWSVAEGTPDCLKEILLTCWLTNPKERPSFSQLGAALSKAMQNAEK